MLPAGFRIFYNRKSMLQTQLVIHSPDCPGRTPEVAKFFLTVQCSRVDNDVIMDMVLIHMGADNKGMVSFCELQCQLPADLISFFWRNFAGLKCLTEMVGDHIICTLISAGQICILSFGQKKLCISKPGITLIAINEFSQIGFLRIFYIINNICNRSRNIPAFSYVQRHQSCGRHFRHLLNLISIREVIIAEKERGCLCAPPNLLNQI